MARKIKHGLYRYRLGCRCPICYKAKTVEKLAYIAKKKAYQESLLISSDMGVDHSSPPPPPSPRERLISVKPFIREGIEVKGYTRQYRGHKPKKPKKQKAFQAWVYRCDTCGRFSKYEIKRPDGQRSSLIRVSDNEPLESRIERDQARDHDRDHKQTDRGPNPRTVLQQDLVRMQGTLRTPDSPTPTPEPTKRPDNEPLPVHDGRMPMICVYCGNPWPCQQHTLMPIKAISSSEICVCPVCDGEGPNVRPAGETPSPHRLGPYGGCSETGFTT